MNLEDVALFAKRSEIESLKMAREHLNNNQTGGFSYWEAKSQAFSQIWEYIIFNGKKVGNGVHPLEYNKQNEIWSKKVEEKENGQEQAEKTEEKLQS